MKLFEVISKKVTENLPAILTIGSIIGVGVSNYFTYKATKKICGMYEEPTKVDFVKAYGPAVAASVVTIAGIAGINKIHLAKYATLASMYAYSQKENTSFKEAAEKIVGKEKTEEIKKEVQNRRVEYFDSNEIFKIKDKMTGRKFDATVKDIQEATAKANLLLTSEGEVSLNQFYEFLGLEGTDLGDLIRWNDKDDRRGIYIEYDTDFDLGFRPMVTISYDLPVSCVL